MYLGLLDGFNNLRKSSPPFDPTDQACPIVRVRRFAEFINLPVYTRIFGEQFERDVISDWFYFFAYRDKESVIDRLALYLKARYIDVWTNDRVGVDICWTPTPLRAVPLDHPYETYLRNATKWLLPSYKVDVTTSFCITYNVDPIQINTAYTYGLVRMYSRASG